MISRMGVRLLQWMAPLPLSWIRALGHGLGLLLYLLVWSRRKVVDVNLRLCFPQWSERERRRVAREPQAAAAQINQEMERMVRAGPTQYLWGYARYKQPRAEAGS